MIFQANDEHQANSIINELQKILDGFESMYKENYLLFCFLNSGTTKNQEYFLLKKYSQNGNSQPKICQQQNTNGGTIL